MNRKTCVCILLIYLGFTAPGSRAQESQEQAGESVQQVTDAFQECFFEALKQKAIENYEKAITALKECEKLQPESAVIHFELGKNFSLLKNYPASVASLQKANRLEPGKEWILAELMNSYSAAGNYEAAIPVAGDLAKQHSKYYEKLAYLYFESQQFNELLSLLDRLEKQSETGSFSFDLRKKVYAATNNVSGRVNILKQAITANPEDKASYTELIRIYTEEGMEKEASEVTAAMNEVFPASVKAQQALYKVHLTSGKTADALEAMKKILEADEIDIAEKYLVLNDFLRLVGEKTGNQEEMLEVISKLAKKEKDSGIYQKLAEFHISKGNKEQALRYLELGLESTSADLELLKKTILLQLDLQKYEAAVNISANGLGIFPAQPSLYLLQGKALIKQGNFNKAEEVLNLGLDYVIDDPSITGDFYQQLSLAYTGMGDLGKAEEFSRKAGKN